MKKNHFWIFTALLTFLLGISAVTIWLFYNRNLFETIEPPPLLMKIDCVKSQSFPGLSKDIGEISISKSGYFPEGIFSGNWKGRDDFINNWYASHLYAMNEQSLISGFDENKEVYRFLWLRSFHHPIFVRVQRKNGKIMLFSKEMNGAGGYKPGESIRFEYKNLNDEQWCNFESLLEKANYWKMPTNHKDSGNDGAQWILEGVKDNRYHIVDRWTPENGEFRDACLYLLKLSGIEVDELQDDLY